ncbi:hypothetical protein [Sphingomonas sp. TDK1]|uniref:hypothetical protein n=1 Tax=Sphingomonas sp. TDK1 TaxID=453247 RepID=UPI0012ED2F7B|nr:hypothetical protein [Sphingomonas sp. TDK1]
MIDTYHGTARLLDFLPDVALPPVSLSDLTGDTSKGGIGASWSGLSRRVAEAWVGPARDLSCGQCRMLVGQRLGLRWLALPVATFAARYPQAECDLYPGDLTVSALLAWRDLVVFAPDATRVMLKCDFGWLRNQAQEDVSAGSILAHAVQALDGAARA